MESVLRDLIAPPRCPACRARAPLEPGAGICSRCRAALAAWAPRIVPLSGAGHALAAVRYLPPATGLVAALKSGRIPAAAAVAAELIAEALVPPVPGTVLVPVGASWRRRLERGLDPAAEIARGLSSRLGLELRTGLLRRRGARPQRGRTRSARLSDPPCFEFAPGRRGPPRGPVLLVDDVVTTGATLASCAGALRAAGIPSAGAVAFAWAPAPGDPAGSLDARESRRRMDLPQVSGSHDT